MGNDLPGLIMGFREGLEAFLIVAIILRFLDKIDQKDLKRQVNIGVVTGVAISFFIGALLYLLSRAIGNADSLAKMWESLASLAALALVTTFIVWMIRHGAGMVQHIERTTAANLSKRGLFLISTMMIAREGAEIAIFTFAGKYSLVSIAIGIAASFVFAMLIYRSLIHVNLKAIFNITLLYLILQAGFLLGYGIHEGLSALTDYGVLQKGDRILAKAYDLSSTILYHKEGALGLPLYVLFGWYSKPEWVQFIAQYGYTLLMLLFWGRRRGET